MNNGLKGREYSTTFAVILHLTFCILFASCTSAASFGRTKPLSHISPVSDVIIRSPNGRINAHRKVIIDVSLPASKQYHNIQRRWWAASDPNNSGFLSSLKLRRDLSLVSWDPAQDTYGMPSEKLFAYLTRNTSMEMEYPEETIDFRLVLEPNEHLFDVPVYILGEDGASAKTRTLARRQDADNGHGFLPMAFRGEAYRKIRKYSLKNGRVQENWHPVGWARVTVEQDGYDPIIEGSWKVDDEENLGVPSSIYHINTLNSMQSTVGKDFELEKKLLDDVSGSRLVIWRDADLRTIQYNFLDIPEDDYSALVASPKLEKRTSEVLDDDRHLSEIIANNGPQFGIFKRENVANDTSGSGFSSGSNLASTIGDSNGCPHPRKIALIGIAADCNFLQQFNSTSEANSHIISVVNSASEVFETSFNITLGLAEITLVNSSTCPSSTDAAPAAQKWNYDCSASSDIGERLSLFSAWRGNRSDDGLATWSLMTNCAEGGVVGLSWLGMACQAAASSNGNSTTVAGANVISHTSLDWRVLAHELGHSYGAVHDCTSDTCSQGLENSSQCCPLSSSTCSANGQYIMNPSSADSQDSFSPCTQGNVCSAIGKNSVNATCLTSNTGVRLVTENECGNGIVEEGEECDCGGEAGCQGNSCCDPTTCRFTSGSQCDDSNDDCCSACRFASSNTVCRSSESDCDPAEYCTGNSTTCPSNRVEPDGQSCTLGNSSLSGLACASGQCTSRDLQCITLLSNSSYTVDGQQLNVSRACDDDSSCQVSCMDPRFGTTCFTTSQNFLDGTPCQSTGHCERGRCVGVSPYSPNSNRPEFDGAWFDRHKGVIIGVICAVGALILAFILWGYVRRQMIQRRMISAYKNQSSSMGQVPGVRPPPPPPPSQGQIYPAPPAWQPTYNASANSAPFYGPSTNIRPPPPPPPARYGPGPPAYS